MDKNINFSMDHRYVVKDVIPVLNAVYNPRTPLVALTYVKVISDGSTIIAELWGSDSFVRINLGIGDGGSPFECYVRYWDFVSAVQVADKDASGVVSCFYDATDKGSLSLGGIVLTCRDGKDFPGSSDVFSLESTHSFRITSPEVLSIIPLASMFACKHDNRVFNCVCLKGGVMASTDGSNLSVFPFTGDSESSFVKGGASVLIPKALLPLFRYAVGLEVAKLREEEPSIFQVLWDEEAKNTELWYQGNGFSFYHSTSGLKFPDFGFLMEEEYPVFTVDKDVWCSFLGKVSKTGGRCVYLSGEGFRDSRAATGDFISVSPLSIPFSVSEGISYRLSPENVLRILKAVKGMGVSVMFHPEDTSSSIRFDVAHPRNFSYNGVMVSMPPIV